MNLARLSLLTTTALLTLITFTSAQDDEKARQLAIERAKKARADGHHEIAVTALEEVYKSISGDAAAMFMLADSAVQTAQFEKAIGFAGKAADLDKSSYDAQKTATMAFFGRAEEAKQEPGATSTRIEGFYETAVSYAKAAFAIKTTDSELWAAQGEIFHCLSRGKESAESFTKASELVPEKVDYLYYAARGHALAKNLGIALELMEKAIQRKPDEAWLWCAKAFYLKDSGIAESASKSAQTFAQALKAKNLDDQSRRDAPQWIFDLIGRARPSEGRSLIEAWTTSHPKDVFSWWWLGYYDLQMKDHASGLKNFAKSFEVSGGAEADAATMAGQCQAALAGTSGSIDMQKIEEAAQWMAKAAKVTSFPWPSRDADPMGCLINFVGAPLVNANKLEQAATLLEKHAFAISKDDYRPLNSLGFVYRELGGRPGNRSEKARANWVKSRDYYVKASELVLKDAQAGGTIKAQVLNDTGLMFHYHFDDIAKGVDYYRKALSHDAGFGDALENMGLCMNKLGKYEEAIGYFERVLRQEPGRPVSLGGLEKAKSSVNK